MQKISASISYVTPFSSGISAIHRIFDGLTILGTLFFCSLYFDVEDGGIYWYVGLLAGIMYPLIAELRSTYKMSRFEGGGYVANKVFSSWVLVCLFFMAFVFSTKTSIIFSRLVIVSWFVITPILLIIGHFYISSALRNSRNKLSNLNRFVIIGDPTSANQLLNKLGDLEWAGVIYCGQFKNIGLALTKIKTNNIEYVFIVDKGDDQENISLINELADTTASVFFVPNIFLGGGHNTQWMTIGSAPIIVVSDHPFYGTHKIIKRMEDILLGLILIVLSSPIMLFVAIGVKLSSPGPILFRQRRYGLNGEIMQIWKFRSMTTMDDGGIVVQAKKGDARVTRFGSFLRKTSLDELPQFFNVLGGSMSLVGPRPHAISHNEFYRKQIKGYMVRHKVKPGITGWAQVNGYRGETDTIDKMRHRIEHDIYYINHWSPALDLKIILVTFFKIFDQKAAY